MSTQVIIRLNDETKMKLKKLAHAEGKNESQVVRELIENYIERHEVVTLPPNQISKARN